MRILGFLWRYQFLCQWSLLSWRRLWLSQGNGPLLSIVRLLAKRATIMLGKVVTKNNNVYNSFTSSWIHAVHFHAIHGQCPSTCPRFQYEQINHTLAKHDVDKRLSSTRSFTFYQVSLLHASCVRKRLCVIISSLQKDCNMFVWTKLCFTCFLGWSSKQLSDKTYIPSKQSNRCLVFSSSLGPFGGPAIVPKHKLSTVFMTKHHVQRLAVHRLSGAVGNPILVYLGLKEFANLRETLTLSPAARRQPFHITGWLPKISVTSLHFPIPFRQLRPSTRLKAFASTSSRRPIHIVHECRVSWLWLLLIQYVTSLAWIQLKKKNVQQRRYMKPQNGMGDTLANMGDSPRQLVEDIFHRQYGVRWAQWSSVHSLT